MPRSKQPCTLVSMQVSREAQLSGQEELMTLSRLGVHDSDIYSEQALDICLAFFKEQFLQRETCLKTRDLENGCISRIVHFLPVTVFHIALIYNAEFVKKVIENLTSAECRFVLTSLVDYRLSGAEKVSSEDEEIEDIALVAIQTWEKEYFEKKKIGINYQLVLCLAALNEDPDFVKFLIDSGADLFQTDKQGNHIIHGLVKISERHPEKAVKALYDILSLTEDIKLKQRLLLTVNNKGHTPLDMASARCFPEMMHALINTDGVYRFVTRNAGIHTHILYDVTHYEKEKVQRGKGVLHSISVITETQLKRLDEFKLLDKEPFLTWMNIKAKSNVNNTRFWMVIWCLYVLLYIVCIIIYGARKQKLPKGYNFFMLCISAVFMVLEVKGWYLNYPYFKMVALKLKKGLFPISSVCAYRVFQTFFIMTVIASQAISLSNVQCFRRTHINLYLQTSNVVFGFMSLMFFTQLSKGMGHYLTIVEKMISNTIAFLSLSFFIFTAFVVSFHINYIAPKCLANGSFEEPPQVIDPYASFSTLQNSFYETFLLSLPVAAPSEWYFLDSNNPSLAIAIYIIMLLVITLVLLNLLIAIMNERVVDICQHKESVLKINQLSIYLLMDEGRKRDQVLMRMTKLFFHLGDIYKFYYTTKNRERIFLHVIEKYEF